MNATGQLDFSEIYIDSGIFVATIPNVTNTDNNAIKFYNGQPVTNGITAGVEERKQRGMMIAAIAKIERQNGVYLVPSQTSPRHQKYRVRYDAKNPTCDCPDFHERGCRCKHVYAVEFFHQREISADGVETITESVKITQTRKTYPQNWPAYNAAQVNESRHFAELLADLCKRIEQPVQDMSKGGRPRLPLAYKPMKRTMRPRMRTIDVSMLHRIVMNLIEPIRRQPKMVGQMRERPARRPPADAECRSSPPAVVPQSR
jgi:hypothetical protein